MLSRHDTLLLKDLHLQPLWLLWVYLVLGVAVGVLGLVLLDFSGPAWLCTGGGFLVALGAEKLVSRRVRRAAMHLLPPGEPGSGG